MTIRAFRQHTSFLPRTALGCATLAALFNLGSHVGLTMSSAGGSLVLLHLVIMGLPVVREVAPGTVRRYEAGALRLFSTAWCFFGLLTALASHKVEQRIRAYRDASRPVSV